MRLFKSNFLAFEIREREILSIKEILRNISKKVENEDKRA